ncbi:3812_t:CDS:2 [Cetraspora pellucida]|uniref:3812_t:CDS:1 n=1 Tax=Cetraspora pellucida TaxID=1433469 RepID=A0ACA9KJA0_9GLOM|nr:3812_t:CDS:2 [Cetraspora pellucida]
MKQTKGQANSKLINEILRWYMLWKLKVHHKMAESKQEEKSTVLPITFKITT